MLCITRGSRAPVNRTIFFIKKFNNVTKRRDLSRKSPKGVRAIIDRWSNSPLPLISSSQFPFPGAATKILSLFHRPLCEEEGELAAGGDRAISGSHHFFLFTQNIFDNRRIKPNRLCLFYSPRLRGIPLITLFVPIKSSAHILSLFFPFVPSRHLHKSSRFG